MTKKKYCPMIIEHEALEMNQAVAACDNKLLYKGVICDSCETGDHYWDVYDEDGIVTQQEQIIAVSASPPIDGQCTASLPITGNKMFGAIGQTYSVKSNGRDFGDGNVMHLKPSIGSTTYEGYIENYLGGQTNAGIATADLIQNS